ncbi:MAG: CHAD domain-containing protein [Phycisphaerae bacterium]|nr:CHAD domain-containing protein [Phycisphaerae bacterium]
MRDDMPVTQAENEEVGEASERSVATRLLSSWAVIVEGALSAAVSHPTASAEARPALVKQVRKSTKSGRALVRLLDGAMSPEAMAGAERSLHEAATILAPIRDRDAMCSTIDGLLEGKLDERAQQAKLLLYAIVSPPSVGDDEEAFEIALVRRAAARISLASELIREVPHELLSGATVGKAMSSLWRKARRRANRAWHGEAAADGSTMQDSTTAHEARKACSRLVHQLNLIEPDLSKPLRRFRQRLRRATSALGDEHDLSLVAECIGLHRGRLGPKFASAVLTVCSRGQRRLRETAGIALAEAMTLRPGELGRRIQNRYDDAE